VNWGDAGFAGRALAATPLLSAAEIARVIFFVVLMLFPISLVLGVVGSRRPTW